MRPHRPAVGLLYNPASPDVIARAGELVEYIAVMPDRMWFDFGPRAAEGRRFHRALGAMKTAMQLAQGRLLAAHGLGLSLPSAMPLDEDLVDAIAAMSLDLGGFRWFSELLSVVLTPKGSVPNAQAGLGLPVVYDDEAFDLITGKLARLRARLGCRLLLENGAFFTPVPDMQMNEPEFLNRLHAQGHCGTLLDLHNLYVGERNGGMAMQEYLDRLDPDVVEEIHLAGGDDFAGFYMDSHSGFTPPEVWRIAFEHVPRYRRLRAITFEFQETYYEGMGAAGVVKELERMHELAECCVAVPAETPDLDTRDAACRPSEREFALRATGAGSW
jgi:uncharacterized protein (UPF0276 family)